MPEMTDRDKLLDSQYKNSDNLNIRTYLHSKFSTNKYGWTKWLFDQFTIPDNSRILELGCGSGGLWADNQSRIKSSWEVILTDISTGMLECTRGSLKLPNFSFIQADATNIQFDDNSFDAVIANHMLHHVPDIEKAISEIRRVLKPGGHFYASTTGIKNMYELQQLVNSYDPNIKYPVAADAIAFNLEGGRAELSKYFEHIETRRYEDSLIITEAKPLVEYVLSLRDFGNISRLLTGDKLNDFYNCIDDLIRRQGGIHITKDAGMFIVVRN